MYNRNLETTISLRGFIIFITYRVNEDWSVEWFLNRGEYEDSMPTDSAIELLESMLRMHEYQYIENELLSEFEARQYEEEARLSALADMEANRIF